MEGLPDINCDLGEGMANDAELMPLISSCNIACGGHAGDEKTVRETILLAQKSGTKIGAHPSFPDRENFGRKEMHLPPDVLSQSIFEQIVFLKKICGELGATLNHVKPHGALYNMAAKNATVAAAFLEAVSRVDKRLFVYLPPKSVVADLAQKEGFRVVFEAFLDRNYENDGSLTPRSHPDAVLHDPEKVVGHFRKMCSENKVAARTGEILELAADTFCIHGDNPAAVEILRNCFKTSFA